jgi:hypothetical protein
VTSRTRTPAPITHATDWDEKGYRLRRAICGVLIHVSDESPRPTCVECLRILRERLEDQP